MKTFKRTLAWMLALCLMCGFLPVGVLADTVSAPTTNLTTNGSPFQKGTGESTSFRIPALVTLSDGTLVAAADARWNTTYDGGGLDTMVAISKDNGATWTHSFANYLGDNGNVYNGSSSTCFIDPALAVRTTDAGDTIYMLCDLYPYGIALNGSGSGNTAPSTAVGFTAEGYLKLDYNGQGTYAYYLKDGQIYSAANNGVISNYSVDEHFNLTSTAYGIDTNLFYSDSPFKVVRTGYLYLTKSTDGGESWSAPQLLNLKTADEMVCLVGPGRGLVTGDGTIVFPVYSYNGSESSQRLSFLYSTDGTNWARSDSLSYSWASESVAIELDENNLRFFFRNGSANLMYVDYNWNTGWATPQSTGLAVNSNCQISAIRLDQTIGGEPVVLVSCPAGGAGGSNQSGASYRINGKIFLFTLGNGNALNYKKTLSVPSVNSANNFMYSCMTALTDENGIETGDIAILYEDHQSKWGAGNDCYYQMSYQTYDVEEAFGVTFGDTPVDPDAPGGEGGEDTNTVPVTVKVGQTVTETIDGVALNGSHPDTTFATVTWTGTTTGGTTVTILGNRVGRTQVSVGDTTYDITVTADVANVIDVELSVGDQYQRTDPTGDYENSITLAPDPAIVTMTVDGISVDGEFAKEALTTLSAGDTFYIEASEGVYLTADAGTTTNLSEAELWKAYKANTSYCTVRNTSGYYLGVGYDMAPYTSQSTLHLKMSSGLLVGYYSAAPAGTPVKVTATESKHETNITFEGKKAGFTTAIIGDTQYNITVLPDITKTVDITVQAGNTFIYTDNSGVFSDILIQPDAKIATAKILGQLKPVTSIESGKQYLIVNRKTGDILTDTVLSVSGQWEDKTGLDTTGKASAESTELWTISEINGEYTVSQNGKYLAIAGFEAHLYDKATPLTLTYTPNGWTICDNQTGLNLGHGTDNYYLSDNVGNNYTGGALGTSIVSNDYIHWDIYEVHPLVEFTGITEGETTAIIGTTQYNITVLPDIYTVVDIELEIGESFTYTDTTGNHANQVILQPDSTYATMVVTGTANGTVKELEPITASTFDPGSRYILENVRAKGSQPAHSVLTSDEAYGGLVMNGPLDAPTSPTWAIIPDNNDYQLYRNGEYVTLGNQTASMESAASRLTFAYIPSSGWLISSNGYYLSDLRGDAAGEAYGYSDRNDAGNYWNIYKEIDLVTSESTQVTFSAVSEGTTTAIVGGTRYRVTVVPAETDDEIMHSATDTWTIDPEIQRQRYSSLIGLDKDLYTDDSWLVYEAARQAAYKKSIEISNAPYPSEADAEAALAKLTLLINELEAAREQLVDAKIISVRYMLNGKSIDIQEYKLRSDENTLELPTTIVVNNTAYNVTNHQLNLGNNTTFEVPVTLVGKLGNGFVASKDIELVHNGNKEIADLTDDDGSGKKITEMTLTVGTSYTLNLATDVTGKTVEWTTEDDAVATVNQSGEVVATGVGTTNITATVKDANGNLVEVNTIPITVFPKGTGKRQTAIYIEDSENNTVWCVINANTDDYAFQVAEGELIYGQFDTTVADNTQTTAISFFSNPHDGHALVHMKSTNSAEQYFLLHDDDGNLYDGSAANAANSAYFVSGTTGGVGYWQAVGLGNNDQKNPNWTPIRDMVQWSIDHGCDGGLGFTRRQTQGPLASNLSFVSNPMPRIEKTVDGVLPVTRKQANYRRYVENMVAAVNEQVYFKITITQEIPTVWQAADASKGIAAESVGAITYSNASISDIILPGGYLYTKELDQADGTWDGNIAPKYRFQHDDITDDLNAPWTADQKAAGIRSFDYYLVYEIQQEDIPKFWIDNIAELSYNYQSLYSKGAQAGSAEAEARITVVGSDIDDVVIDFGQSITYSGLKNAQLKGVYVDGTNDDPSITSCHASAKYGDVSVTREQICDADGVPQTDYNGYPLYNYTVTYTPHSILHETDAVVLYGVGEMGQEKIINGFLVYPATTVYYEEGFMMNDASNWSDGDDKTYDHGAKATGQQTLELLGKSQYDEHGVPTTKVTGQKHPYGYDPLYEHKDYTHGNSYALSNTVGNTTTFTFTGTGFDLYANCAQNTGYVSVVVKNSAGRFVKMYTVNTVVKSGETPATSGQTGEFFHLPIVSVDLKAHDTYTVTLTKIMNSNPVMLDGIRIHNTLADSSVYNIDLEDNPEFYQLRNYVLTAVDVNKVASEAYGPDWMNEGSITIGNLSEQVYGTISTDSERPYALITSTSDIYGSGVTAQDLLDNGPKNELYLYPDQTLTFQVTTSREMQIGLKAPRTATSYTLSYRVGSTTTSVATEKSLATSVDMFYALGNPIGTETTYSVTLTNTGRDILSVTDLKICDDPGAAFAPLTARDVEQLLMDAGLGNSETGESEKFDIAFTQVEMGNALNVRLAFAASAQEDWSGAYAVATKTYADGRENLTVTIPATEWQSATINGAKHYYFSFSNISGKEMADDIKVTIYNAKDEAISNEYTESIRSYVMRVLDNQNAKTKTLLVDMLNYGSAAQSFYKYGTADLANSQLTAAQKAYGTADVKACTDIRVQGANYQGTRLELKSSIVMQFAFKGLTADMTAKVEFTNHRGVKVSETVKPVMTDDAGLVIAVKQIVAADGRMPVTVTVYDANGDVYGTATDSLESYLARMGTASELYASIMKFSDSAYNYLQ